MDTVIKTGEFVSNFRLNTIDGKRFSLAEQLGKIVLINFWSAECPWSERADNSLLSLRPSWGEEVVWASVASNANEPLRMVEEVAKDRGVSLVLHDSNQNIANKFGAVNTPHIFIIDAKGILVYQGALNDVTFRQRTETINYVSEVIQALRNGESSPLQHMPSYGCTVVYEMG